MSAHQHYQLTTWKATVHFLRKQFRKVFGLTGIFVQIEYSKFKKRWVYEYPNINSWPSKVTTLDLILQMIKYSWVNLNLICIVLVILAEIFLQCCRFRVVNAALLH